MILASLLSSLGLSALFTWALIVVLNRKKAYVAIKPELLVQKQEKSRTPFFGGLAFIIPIILSSLLFSDITSEKVYIPLFSFLFFSMAGFFDDVLKLKSTNGDGFTTKQKLLSQLICASMVAFLIIGKQETEKEYLRFFPIVVFLTYYVNAVNITDGVDGLASVSTLVVLVLIVIIGFLKDSEVSIQSISMIGCLLGFLIFNHSPAKIFMGDVGSHAIGALVATIALMMDLEIIVFISGLLYLVEFSSSLLQIISIRAFRKKLFKIAPIHHLLEYKGWKPGKIVLLLSSVNILGSIAAFLVFWWSG